jgi:hypothetical protein
MTPKEKAEELINKFQKHTHECDRIEAKQCALIAVDEIINWHLEFLFISKESVGHQYWLDVKQEIEKL